MSQTTTADLGALRSATTSAPRNMREVVKDDRGVLMMTGVVFTFVLIGCAWFIAGIGNAIAYRENLQNAADSSAFAAAVYDARGMNLLAMINIIMAVTLALLVIVKVAEFIAIVAKVEACNSAINVAQGICESIVLSAGCPVAAGIAFGKCVADCSKIPTYNSDANKADKGIHVALEAMHDLEVGLAVAWPWIAAGKSVNMQGYYTGVGIDGTGGVQATTSFAFSQIPWSLDNHTGSLLTAVPPTTAQAGSTGNNTGVRYGLPVQSDTYANLCRVMFNDVATVGGLLGNNGLSTKIGGALDWFSQFMCDDETGGSGWTDILELLPDAFGPKGAAFCIGYKIATNPVSFVKSVFGTSYSSLTGAAGGVLEAISLDPMSDNGVSGADGTPTGNGGGHGGIPATDYKFSPMTLYQDPNNAGTPVNMGTDYFAIWGSSVGSYGTNGDNQTAGRVQIAGQQAGGSNVVAALPTDVAVAVAKSEFYYEPNVPVSNKDTPAAETQISTDPTVADNALWNMRWRARLRRFHYFPGAVGQFNAIFDDAMRLVSTFSGSTFSIQDLMGTLLGTNMSSFDPPPPVAVGVIPSQAPQPFFH